MDQRLTKAGLTQTEIRALAMYYGDGCRVQDIADLMGFKDHTGAVRLLKRAKAKLAKAGLPEPQRREPETIGQRPCMVPFDPHVIDNMVVR